MRKMKYCLLVGLMGLGLMACSAGTGTSTGSETTAKAESGDITIRVASRYGADVPDEVYYRKMVEEFNALDNGITVEMDHIPTESDYLDKLRTSFANGDTPNVFIEYGGSRVLDYIESDALVNMQTYYEEDPDWYNSFYKGMFGDLTYDEYEGIWGVPFKSYAISLYYNKEIFEEAGLTPPESFDDLLKVCEALQEKGIRPFQVGEKDIWRFGHLHNNLVIKSLGVEGANSLNTRELAYDSEEMQKTYQYIIDLNEKGYLGTDILNTDYNTEKSTFAEGGCAMRWDGSWYVSEIYGTEIYDKTGAVAFPYINAEHKNEAQGGASDMWFISKLGKSEEEIAASVEFVKYITSKEYFLGLNEAAATLFPVDIGVVESKNPNPLLDEVKTLVSGYTAMSTDIQNGDPASYMLDTVRNALQGLAMGNSAKDCAAEIMEAINR